MRQNILGLSNCILFLEERKNNAKCIYKYYILTLGYLECSLSVDNTNNQYNTYYVFVWYQIFLVLIHVCYLLEQPHPGHHVKVFLGAAEIMGQVLYTHWVCLAGIYPLLELCRVRYSVQENLVGFPYSFLADYLISETWEVIPSL